MTAKEVGSTNFDEIYHPSSYFSRREHEKGDNLDHLIDSTSTWWIDNRGTSMRNHENGSANWRSHDQEERWKTPERNTTSEAHHEKRRMRMANQHETFGWTSPVGDERSLKRSEHLKADELATSRWARLSNLSTRTIIM
jgi:hypothetical protein